MFLKKKKTRKWAVGISILIIRSGHLLKKLLPAAVKESQTSLRSSSSIELIRLSSSETVSALVPFLFSCLHPTTQLPNNGEFQAERKHLKQDYKQITVAGQDDKALIYYINSYTLSIRRSVSLSVPPLLTRCSHSWHSGQVQCPVWKHARPVCDLAAQKYYFCNSSQTLHYYDIWESCQNQKSPCSISS